MGFIVWYLYGSNFPHSCQPHHDISNPSLLRLPSRKPLWNQLTSTVNGENPGSRPRWSMHTSWTTTQSDNRALLSLDNSGLSWTVSAPDKVTAVLVRRNGNFQTPISVPVVRPKRCHTLSNPAHRQDYTVAWLNYTLQTMMPSPGWPAKMHTTTTLYRTSTDQIFWVDHMSLWPVTQRFISAKF